MFVQNAQKVSVKNYAEVKSLITEGNRRRSVATTKSNARSSRSHAILTIYISQTDLKIEADMSEKDVPIISKITLVDLAGSERVEKLGASGAQLRESVAINRSLSTLADVIHVLSKGGKHNQHIPYRNSVLTRLLKESLGGNTITVMLAAISPCCIHYEETLGTLKYLDRAKRVTNCPHVNSSSCIGTRPDFSNEISDLKAKLQSTQRLENIRTLIPACGGSSRDGSEMSQHLLDKAANSATEEPTNLTKVNDQLTRTIRSVDTRIEQKSTQTIEGESESIWPINWKLRVRLIELLNGRRRLRYLEKYRAFKVLYGLRNQVDELSKPKKSRSVTRFRLPSASPEEDEETSVEFKSSEFENVYETLDSLSIHTEKNESARSNMVDERKKESSLELLEEIATCCCSAISSKHRSICKVKLQQWRKNESDFGKSDDQPTSAIDPSTKDDERISDDNNAESNFLLQKSTRKDMSIGDFAVIQAYRASTGLTPGIKHKLNPQKYMEERLLLHEEEVYSSRFETITAKEELLQVTNQLFESEKANRTLAEVHLTAFEKVHNRLLLLSETVGAYPAAKEDVDSPETLVPEPTDVNAPMNKVAENQESLSKRPDNEKLLDTNARCTEVHFVIDAISSSVESYMSSFNKVRNELSAASANARISGDKLAKMMKEQKEASKKIKNENATAMNRMEKDLLHASIKIQKTEQDLRDAESQLLEKAKALEALEKIYSRTTAKSKAELCQSLKGILKAEKELEQANDRIAEYETLLKVSDKMRALPLSRLREEVALNLIKITESEKIKSLEDQLAACKISKESSMIIITQIKERLCNGQAQELLAKNEEVCLPVVGNTITSAETDPMIGQLHDLSSTLIEYQKAHILAFTHLEEELRLTLAKVVEKDEQLGLVSDKLAETQAICKTVKHAKNAEIDLLRNELKRSALVITELDGHLGLSKERVVELQSELGISHEDHASAIAEVQNKLYVKTTENAKNEEDLILTREQLATSTARLASQKDIEAEMIACLKEELANITSALMKTKQEQVFLNNQLKASEALNENFQETNAKLEEELSLSSRKLNILKDELLHVQSLLTRAEASYEEASHVQTTKFDKVEKELSLAKVKLKRAEEDLQFANKQSSEKETLYDSSDLTPLLNIHGRKDEIPAGLSTAANIEIETVDQECRRNELHRGSLTNKESPSTAFSKFSKAWPCNAETQSTNGRQKKEEADQSHTAAILSPQKELLSSIISRKRMKEDYRHIQDQSIESGIADGALHDAHTVEFARLKEDLAISLSQTEKAQEELILFRKKLAKSESIYKASVEIHRGSLTQVQKKMGILTSEINKTREELILTQGQLTDSQALAEHYRQHMERLEKELVRSLTKAAECERELIETREERFHQEAMITKFDESHSVDVAAETMRKNFQDVKNQETNSSIDNEALSGVVRTEAMRIEEVVSLSNEKGSREEGSICWKSCQPLESQSFSNSPDVVHFLTTCKSRSPYFLKADNPKISNENLYGTDTLEKERIQIRLADYESIIMNKTYSTVTRRLEEDAFCWRREVKRMNEELYAANGRTVDFWVSFEALMKTNNASIAQLQEKISLSYTDTSTKNDELARIIEELEAFNAPFDRLKEIYESIWIQPRKYAPAQSWSSGMENESVCMEDGSEETYSFSVPAKHRHILATDGLKFRKFGGTSEPWEETHGTSLDLMTKRYEKEESRKSGCDSATPTTHVKAAEKESLGFKAAFKGTNVSTIRNAQVEIQAQANVPDVSPTHNIVAACKEHCRDIYEQILLLDGEYNKYSYNHVARIEQNKSRLKKHRDHLVSFSAWLPSLRHKVDKTMQIHLSAEARLLLHKELISARVNRLEQEVATNTKKLIEAKKKFDMMQKSSGNKSTQLEKQVAKVSAELDIPQREFTRQSACLAVVAEKVIAKKRSLRDSELKAEVEIERREFYHASIASINTVPMVQTDELVRKVSPLERECENSREQCTIRQRNEAVVTEKVASQMYDLEEEEGKLVRDEDFQAAGQPRAAINSTFGTETLVQDLQLHSESLPKLANETWLQFYECHLMQKDELTSRHALEFEHLHHAYQKKIEEQLVAVSEWKEKLEHQTSALWQLEKDFREYMTSSAQEHEHLHTMSEGQATCIKSLQLELNRYLMCIEDMRVYLYKTDFESPKVSVISPRKEEISRRITSYHLQNLDDWFEQNISTNEDSVSKVAIDQEGTLVSSFDHQCIVTCGEVRYNMTSSIARC